MDQIFFNGWTPIVRTLLIGVMAYVGLIIVLRVSGKRTLSKMNAFDLIVTVALGSTLATILLNKDVSLAQGMVALSLLVGMQFVVTWLSVRYSWVKKTVTGEPTLVAYHGELLRAAMKQVRVTEEEVYAALRSSGQPALRRVNAVILETDGSFTVVPDSGEGPDGTINGVEAPGLVRH